MLQRSLWREENRRSDNKVISRPAPFTDIKVAISDKIDDKFFLMDISAEIKMSFLSGLIEVGGSAAFLNEKKSSSRMTSVTLKSHKISHTEVSYQAFHPGVC